MILPWAQTDFVSLNEDSSVVVDVLQNDFDAEGTQLIVDSISMPSQGIATLINQQVSYTPTLNYFGTDSLTYVVRDGEGLTTTGTISITVNSVNDRPVAVNDSETLDEDNSIIIDVLANDSDVEDATLSLESVATPRYGAVTISGDRLSYTPTQDYNGPDLFHYIIQDSEGLTATAAVSLTINSVNDRPVAVDDAEIMVVNTDILIHALANDRDVDGDVLSLNGLSQPANGAAAIGGGYIFYTPTVGYIGSDQFSYTINDTSGLTDTATISVTVTDRPAGTILFAPASARVEQGKTQTVTLSIDLGSGGYGSGGYRLTYDETILTLDNFIQPAGSLGAVNTDTPGIVLFNTIYASEPAGLVLLGTFLFEGAAYGFSDLNLELTQTPQNRLSEIDVLIESGRLDVGSLPVVVDDRVRTLIETPATIDVLANDSELNGEPLTLVDVTQPERGTVAIEGMGLVYTPTNGFVGEEYFVYTVRNSSGFTNTGQVTATVEVPNGTLVIKKVALPADGTDFDFQLSYPWTASFTLDDALSDDGDGVEQTYTFSKIPVERYVITESILLGWHLTGVGCDGGTNSPTLIDGGFEIELADLDLVTCTFTNTVNAAPTLVVSSTVMIAEGQPYVVDVDARDDVDQEGAGLTYSLSGIDAEDLDIDSTSGEISFVLADPYRDSPRDANLNNIYEVVVTVTDSDGESTNQNLAIEVVENKGRLTIVFDLVDQKGPVANDISFGTNMLNLSPVNYTISRFVGGNGPGYTGDGGPGH